MENQEKPVYPKGRTARVDASICNLDLQKFCYNDDGSIKAVIIDEGFDRDTGNTFYLCEFPNKERKWIYSHFCWISEEIAGIYENVTYVRRGK